MEGRRAHHGPGEGGNDGGGMNIEDERFRALCLARHPTADRRDIEAALDDLAYTRVPAHILTVGLIVSIHGWAGWRGAVLQFALWAIEKAGHVVVRAGRS